MTDWIPEDATNRKTHTMRYWKRNDYVEKEPDVFETEYKAEFIKPIDEAELAEYITPDTPIKFQWRERTLKISKHSLTGELYVSGHSEKSISYHYSPEMKKAIEERMAQPKPDQTEHEQVVIIYKLLQKFAPVFKYVKQYNVFGYYDYLYHYISLSDNYGVVFENDQSEYSIVTSIKTNISYKKSTYSKLVDKLIKEINKLPKTLKKLQKNKIKLEKKRLKLLNNHQKTTDKANAILDERVFLYCQFCGKTVEICECDGKKC